VTIDAVSFQRFSKASMDANVTRNRFFINNYLDLDEINGSAKLESYYCWQDAEFLVGSTCFFEKNIISMPVGAMDPVMRANSLMELFGR
jgi:hypothetical protein